MNFRVFNRDGPARIGQLIFDDKKVGTPNIIFLDSIRARAPDFSEILLTNTNRKTKISTIQIDKSYFSEIETKREKKGAMNNCVIYPKDVSNELHLCAIIQKKNTNWNVLTAKKELISQFIKNNDATLIIVSNAIQLFSQQSDFVDFIVELRKKIGYQKVLYLPCVGDPSNIALLAYMGLDFIDSFSAIMAARNEILLFPTGCFKKNDLSELPCSCPSCIKIKNVSEMNYKKILEHNYYAFLNEIKLVRNAIVTGSLRELVETRVRTNPHLSSILRILDLNHYQFLEERTPVVRKQLLITTTNDSLMRAEIRRFQQRIIQRYEKPPSAKILLLLPCSAKKPYSFSKSHKLFRERILNLNNPFVIHELILTSPLGLVPRELELIYPACRYDIPVTGYWDENEKKMIRSLLQQYLQKNYYDAIIMHIPPQIQEFIVDLLKNPTLTCINSPTSTESLDKLSDVLQKTTQTLKKVNLSQRAYENIKSIASYQMSTKLAEQLLIDCKILGKYPYQKIMKNNKQLGMITEERGFISLTIEGAQQLVNAKHYWVEIFDDFILKGSVFAPGIKNADESIRIGDEVIIKKNINLCGVGVALMNGREMIESDHGEAVKIRHHI